MSIDLERDVRRIVESETVGDVDVERRGRTIYVTFYNSESIGQFKESTRSSGYQVSRSVAEKSTYKIRQHP